jgi:hypothetical protein
MRLLAWPSAEDVPAISNFDKRVGLVTFLVWMFAVVLF